MTSATRPTAGRRPGKGRINGMSFLFNSLSLRMLEAPGELLPRAKLFDAFSGCGVPQAKHVRRDLLDRARAGQLRELLQRRGLDVGAADDEVHAVSVRARA